MTWVAAALAIAALIGAGCASTSGEDGTTGASSGGGDTKSAARGKGVRFAKCMRENGVRDFPDPDASGELTIDGIANGTSLNTDSAAFKNALGACRDLEPSGFTGRERSAGQQENALRFAQCMRDNGVKDFPDPTKDGPLIDTTRIPSAAGRGARDIPGFQTAVDTCHDALAGALERRR